MANTVVGVFEDVRNAEDAVQELLDAGFYDSEVDIAYGEEGAAEIKDNRGGISRFFSSLMGDEDEIRKYTEIAERGAVVTVHTDSKEEAESASDILDMYDAVNPDERSDLKAERGTTTSTANTGDSIPVIEENMEVGKRKTETGSVRVKSRIFEKPVEENIRLRSERISVERVPVNRPASEKDLDTFKESTIEATEHEEVPVVNKEARVVEEVRLRKEAEERDKKIRGSVRKQDVDIEKDRRDKKYTSGEDETLR